MAYDLETGKTDSPNMRRREALRSLGGGALVALAASTLTGQANAADPAIARMPNATNELAALPQNTPLGRLNASQVQALNLTARLPDSTAITALGLTPAGVALLTPAAAKLTKGDLQALGAGQIVGAGANLTVVDLASIGTAFGTEYRAVKGGGTTPACCCCTTPCCCCCDMASVSSP